MSQVPAYVSTSPCHRVSHLFIFLFGEVGNRYDDKSYVSSELSTLSHLFGVS